MACDTTDDSGGVIAELEILRGDLVRILHEATATGVECVFDDGTTSLTQTPAGVEVTFERGEPRTFDLVIGADGPHSEVRSPAFGPEPRSTRDLGAVRLAPGRARPVRHGTTARADRRHVRGRRQGVARLLGDLGGAPDSSFDRLCQVRMDTWSDGGGALLGDPQELANTVSLRTHRPRSLTSS